MTTLFIWPNGTYFTNEDSSEELEQHIAHNGDDFQRLVVPDEMTNEAIAAYVAVHMKLN